MKFQLVTAILFSIVQTEFLQSQWVHINGPEGGSFSCFSKSSISDSTERIFVGVYGGVYLSTDSGSTWKSASEGLPQYNSVSAIQILGKDIIAGTYGGGIFRSTNGGTNWSSVSTDLTSSYIQAFAALGTTLFVSTSDGVFASVDSGTHWKSADSGLTVLYILDFAVKGQKLFAASSNGVFRSTDNGTHWTSRNIGLTNTFIYDLAVLGPNIYAGTDGGVYLSTDDGDSWLLSNTGIIQRDVQALAVSGNNLFAGTWGGSVFLSTDNGAHWNAASIGLTSAPVMAMSAIDGKVLLGTLGAGVFWTNDAGTGWNQSLGISLMDIQALAVVHTYVFAGTSSAGVYLSTNNGIDWKSVNNGLTNLNIRTLAADSTAIFAGTAGGIFCTTNQGISWQSVNDSNPGFYCSSLTVTNNRILAGGSNGSILFSADHGVSWHSASTGTMNRTVVGLAFYSTTTYAAISGLFMGGIYDPATFYFSNDDGSSWIWHGRGIPSGSIQAIALSGTSLFLATDRGVYRSSILGGDWWPANSGLIDMRIGALAIAPNGEGGNYLFAGAGRTGTGGGVFLSRDDGASWSSVSLALGDFFISVIATDRSYLYAGTNSGGGIWMRSISEITGTNAGIKSPLDFRVDQNYPNPFNPSTAIRFSIAERSRVRVTIYNLLGQQVAELANEEMSAGNFERTWNANVASGLYFYRLEAVSVSNPGKRFVDVKKMILLK